MSATRRIPLLPWPFYGRRSLGRLGPEGLAGLRPGSPEHRLLELLDAVVRDEFSVERSGEHHRADLRRLQLLDQSEQLLRALRTARRSAVAARADAQRRVKALIVTRGAEGSHIHTGGKCIEIPVSTPKAVLYGMSAAPDGSVWIAMLGTTTMNLLQP